MQNLFLVSSTDITSLISLVTIKVEILYIIDIVSIVFVLFLFAFVFEGLIVGEHCSVAFTLMK